MRRILIRCLITLLLPFVAAALAQPSAYSDGTVCEQMDPSTGQCLLWVTLPQSGPPPASDEGPQDTGSGQACYWDPSKQGVVRPPAAPVPCTSQYGYWSNAYNCYVKPVDPQPLAGDPSWNGHEPGDGAVYFCFQPQTDLLTTFWAQDRPPGAGAGPSPREVAQVAVEEMNLRAIRIGIAPNPGPNSVGIVGMPVWMWAKNPDAHTFGPITATASAGGITITATARVLKVMWDMGDGTTVMCKTAGTPYDPSYGRKDSPTCGHQYLTSSADQPNERFEVSATTSWVITWSGAGQTGTIRLDGLVRSTQITIGEAQVLVN